ncbi:cytochrome P450 71AU50-like [Magnolia sinica]|uniref:cytochrome P450 71AU50-like n=1 Tax=Magnolia sinica TaxID=86752 RepID=UPI00265A15A7|nr:cytochrome P450 71AU50-like [Magnolia sinica]
MLTMLSPWTALMLVLMVGAWAAWTTVYLIRSIRGKEKWATMARTTDWLPPGPRGLPILGSLLNLGDLPHRTLHKLAMEYGPIMHMQLGQVQNIIVSSPQAAQLFLKTHDLIFASRPVTEVSQYIYNRKAVTFSQYGAYWRNLRKLYTIELLSSLKIESFKPMRREEVGLLVQSLKDTAKAGIAADLTAKVAALSTDMTCRMLLGKKYINESFDEGVFKGVVEEFMHLLGVFNISDYVPYTRVLDLQGLGRRMKEVHKVFDRFFEKIIDEHVQERDARQPDFVNFMLSFMESNDCEFHFDRTNIKAILMEILVAALDTTSITIEWALSELLRNPRVLKKAHLELENIIGLDREVEESDLANLEYLNMVVKEAMRLHPAAPLLIPHEAMEDCTVDRFHIPKKSHIIINAWAIGRDPNSWSNPEEFYPERFIGTHIDVRGQDFQLLPFGSGRRGCPGLQLGLTAVQFVLAQLVHCFDWELPNGMSPTDLDMTEKCGIVTARINHLWAIPAYRLKH